MDDEQMRREMRELEQYKTARLLMVIVVGALLVLVLACLASMTIIVGTLLAHLGI
jgi:hypothetical protein